MGSSADQDSGPDISESEMEKHEAKSYEELKSGIYLVKIGNKLYTCPYCPNRRACSFLYEDVLKHASGVGNGNSTKRTNKEKANHLALARYLAVDVSQTISYEERMNGNRCVRVSDGTYTCPYCPKKRKCEFIYQELLQHASGIGMCKSNKRTISDKANHLALAKYLEKYAVQDRSHGKRKNGSHRGKVSGEASTSPSCPKKEKYDSRRKELFQPPSGIGKHNSKTRTLMKNSNLVAVAKFLVKDSAFVAGSSQPAAGNNPLSEQDRDEMFVWPWVAIVVNLPTEWKEGRCVGRSGAELRYELITRGFSPTRARPLWNALGYSGITVVEFCKDWSGFHNAMSFEKSYEADHRGKRNWLAGNANTNSGPYAWVARSDDYTSNSIIGERLRKSSDLRTVADIMEEEARKTSMLVLYLKNVIEVKKAHFEEIKNNLSKESESLNQLIEEKDKLLQADREELQKIQSDVREHQKMLDYHGEMNKRLEIQKKELELKGEELEKRRLQNEQERRNLSEEFERRNNKGRLMQS